MKRPAVFLDRDNTIIHNDGDLGDPDEVKLIQGVASAIASVCGLGYKVVVVTNQGGVARGKYSEEDVDAVHDRIEELVHERANGARIDAFYFCPFHPQGKVARYKKEHPTRKPKPGMLLQAAEDLDLDLSQSWMVGDALRDIEAGAAAGCRTVLLQADWTNTSLADLRKQEAAKAGKKSVGRGKKAEPDFVAKGLVEAVRIIASQRKPEASEEISRTRIAGKRWDAEAMAKLQQPRAKAESEAPTAETADPPEEQPEESKPEAAVENHADPEEKTQAVPKSNGSTTPTSAARPFVPWTKQAPPEEGSADEATTADVKTPTEEKSSDPSPEADKQQPSDAEIVHELVASDPPPAADPEALTALNKTMRLVLQELRMQRGTSGEFHQLGVVAIVIQAVAVICLLGAVWMGGGDGGTPAFLRWISVALLLQLGVIATLLFSRPSG
ncbi:MAG: HAD-IIIA family hydrolase [Planctomycetota bacterium]